MHVFTYILRYTMLRRTLGVFDQGKSLAHFCLIVMPREFSMSPDLQQHYERRRLARLREACCWWKLCVAAEYTVRQIQLIMDASWL